MQIGGFRFKLSGVLIVLAALVGMTGCKSNASPAVANDSMPTADTGYISAGTTGGDAAGTANMKVDDSEGSKDKVGAESMQGGRASRTPQQQAGNAGD